MREAFHVNNQQLYIIPQNLSNKEIQNHKGLANKGSFKCPYCAKKLLVKSGPIYGNFFSHYHEEACEPSKQSEARTRKYIQLKKNDSPRHPDILEKMYDMLIKISKSDMEFKCTYGYLDTEFSKFIPDISIKINDTKYAITIVTNINNSTDNVRAKSIMKQSEYYKSLNYEPLFFIERSILSIDTDGKSLVLWQSEKQALSIQLADMIWREFLIKLAPAKELHQVFKIPSNQLKVQSILYISFFNANLHIEVFHILENIKTNPPKAYFFSQPYQLEIKQAFKVTNGFLTLANMEIEESNQKKYVEQFQFELESTLKELEFQKARKYIYDRY